MEDCSKRMNGLMCAMWRFEGVEPIMDWKRSAPLRTFTTKTGTVRGERSMLRPVMNSWLVIQSSLSSVDCRGRRLGLIAAGFPSTRLLEVPGSCDLLEFGTSGEGRLATKGNDCTLLVGVVL